ncbi:MULTISPECIES: OmpA family protein [Flavobacterium]|uniref:Flagellar motor protein MotB n=1 Tax=Flavobacterium chungangense TaxID=554283 RepID=A0A6V6Z4Z2_9FLAO|nr:MULTISPECIES: OmpA family protein [Flavobacterium]OOV17078.1 flagellar motor protein MotB [Flavobacterium sp. LM4]CAD0006858.1 flagellar motor protein MotB [Flavobacterium chungangense]
MKKIVLLLVLIATLGNVTAQTSTGESLTDGNYNKWSIEFAGGFNKPQKPMTFSTSTPNLYVVDLGARYMFNNKFGLKADFGYNSFQEGKNTPEFSTKYYRIGLQGVANLGRIMNFENWTNTIGLLGHGGFGAAHFEDQNSPIKDKMFNFIAGVTAQIKLSNKLAITGDLTTILNASQDYSFDAASTNKVAGFSGILFNGTIGLTLYLGKNEKHADWITLIDKDALAQRERIDNLEKMLIDSDKDGVADYLDLEPNTIAGLMVDSKGRAVDLNNNGIPDELESYLTKTYPNKINGNDPISDSESITKLVNGGYVAAYFDFNKSTPTDSSIDGINFVVNYLRNNPSASVEITGYADEIGNASYNEKLANERANSVKDILLKAKIASERINVTSGGVDASVDKESALARKLARRVTFKIKN